MKNAMIMVCNNSLNKFNGAFNNMKGYPVWFCQRVCA